MFELEVKSAGSRAAIVPSADLVRSQIPDGSRPDMASFARMGGASKRQAIAIRPGISIDAGEFEVQDRALLQATVRHLPLGPRYRAGWKISGVEPSFAFSVKATLHTA